MAKHQKPEKIVAELRQADVLMSQDQSVSDAIRALGVSSMTYDRWRREFGGRKSDQVRRMKESETENQRLQGDRGPHSRQADPTGVSRGNS